MRYREKIMLIGCLAISFSGCDTVRNTLGLDHYSGDAFAVPINPPLVIPPNYTLTPPVPGAPPAYAKTPEVEAQHVLQTNDAKVYTHNHAEKSLVAAQKTPNNIRELVNQEAEEEATLEGKLNKKMADWKEEAKENFESIHTAHATEKTEETKENSPQTLMPHVHEKKT